MSGFEGDGDKGQGRAHARPLLFLCSSAGSFFARGGTGRGDSGLGYVAACTE